ncbi:MAG: hypothetical protein MMC23_002807 [Stictis urceolatum]|nr:hypothetical protein [Stictis urceolata]
MDVTVTTTKLERTKKSPERNHRQATTRDRQSTRTGYYGFDELWALKEEEEEHSLILILEANFSDQFFADSIWADSFEPGNSPPYIDASSIADCPDRRSVSSTSTTRTTRSLTDPPPLFHGHDEMTSFAERSDSPPELSSSKSSKSSSFRSSTFSGYDGTVSADMAHFEDIGLNDELSHREHNNVIGHGSNKKSSVRNLAGPVGAGKNHTAALPGMRELVNGASRTSLSGVGTPRLDANSSPVSSLSLPPGARRPMASPQTISQASMRNRSRSRSRSRSPSPSHLMQGLVTPSSITPSSIAANSPALRSVNSFDRRRSSNALPTKPRKTAKEIENEYNDSDEDLPDDASLWNVPMSPKMYRTASSAATSANPSASTSPERPSKIGTPKASKTTPVTTPRTAPVISKEFPPSFQTTPPTPHNFARLSRGNTTGTMPDTYAFGKGRAKSWNHALSDLSDEAKALSEALDAHDSQQNEVAIEDPLTDPPPAPLRSQSTTTNLPPLRTNNVMIDPLPISKEKERFLSRTRPSWLPPKNPKEEKKHLKEYQRMMSASLEAEKRRAAKLAAEKCARDETALTLQRLWNEHVLPHWDFAVREPRTRELWWRGIPASVRPEAWKRAVGNALELTPSTFEKARARAKSVEASVALPSKHSQDMPREVAWLKAIRRDVESTFPQLALFQPGQPRHADLLDVLQAYAFYRADVGYVYGTHLPAGLLLLTLGDPGDAFVALANFLNRPLPLAFLTGDPAGTSRSYELVLRLLGQKREGLTRRLFGTEDEGGLGLSAEEVLEPALRLGFLGGCCEAELPSSSLDNPNPNGGGAGAATGGSVERRTLASDFTGSGSSKGLSLPLALRLWDIIVFDGDAAMVRCAVGLLAAKEAALYGSREEVLDILGWGGSLGLGRAESEGKEVGEADLEDGYGEEVERVVQVVRDVGKEEVRKRAGKRKSENGTVKVDSGSGKEKGESENAKGDK